MKKRKPKNPDLDEIRQEVMAFAEDREWLQFHTPKNLSMALASEAAELMEVFLWCESHDSRALPEDSESKARIEEELADILIYALQMANVTGIDPTRAIRSKLESNARKYPVALCRGRSLKYTELDADGVVSR